jgi:hypothetical protein
LRDIRVVAHLDLAESTLMDLTRILSTLRSERDKIDQAICFWEQPNRLETQSAEAVARFIAEIGRRRKSHAKVVLELRSELEYVGHAIIALERLDRRSAERAQAAAG